MQARRLPAARGVFWLLEGWRLFRRNPPLLTSLTLLYLLVMQVLVGLLPGVGPILMPLLLPVMTLIIANGCRLVDQKRAPDKAGLLQGVSGNGPALLRLGGLQLLGAVLVVLLSMALGGGEDPFAVPAPPPETPNMGATGESAGTAQTAVEMAAQAAVLGKLAQLLLLAAPLILAFWFAPFLVGWDRVAPLKALFFSAVASLRNWSALGLFTLAALAAAGLVPGFILIVVGQISGMALSAVFIALRMILVLLVAPVLTAAIYVSYRDIFQPAVDTNA